MTRSCSIIPQVRDKEGNLKDSKLFKDLLSFTSNNRAQAKRLYQITKSQEFISQLNPVLTMDELGEPTLGSLLQHTDLKTYIPDTKVLSKLNQEIGHFKKDGSVATWPLTQENMDTLTQRAVQFNNGSEFNGQYVASISKVIDGETGKPHLEIQVDKKTPERAVNAQKMTYNHQLNTQLRNILSAHGVSVGALTDLEQRMGINGVTDFEQAKHAADGLVELIRIAQGEKGEQALPEEFAHFALKALGDNPLATRLVNLIATNGLAKQILGNNYDEYVAQYADSEVKLAEEAAGKLLADHLLKQAEIPAAPYRTLLQRVIDAIKNLFRRLDSNQVQKAMMDADQTASKVAKDILGGNLSREIDLGNIKDDGKLYQLSDRVARDRKMLQGIIDNELKRLKIYEKRNPDSPFSANQRILIDKLESELAANNEVEGIYSFVQNTLEELGKVNNRLISLQGTQTDVRETAKVLRDVRNYLFSYKQMLDTIREALLEEETLADNRYGDRVRNTLDSTSSLLNDLFIKYNKVATPIFVDFIRPFVGEGITVPFGKWKGKVIGAEELVKIADEDISFFDRYLDSMADSASPLLRVIDQAVKKSKETARLDTINYRARLEAAMSKLEKAGVKDTEWMFEKDSQGHKTGKYISEIDWAKYNEEKAKMQATLVERYGANPTGEDANKFAEERRQWFLENLDNQRKPILSKYASKQYSGMSAAQKEYYDTIMAMKAELDSYLPDHYTTLTNAVKIRKDLLERVKQSDGVKSGATQIWEALKDNFIRRTDDTDLGTKATIKDFEGNEVQMLPIYYTKLREGESADDISTDVTSTMLAYAAMANDFKEMNKVVDVLEVGRDILRDQLEITKTEGGKPLTEKFTQIGRQVESKVTKGKDNRRIIQRLNDFYEMQVYGRYMADEGTIGKKIDVGKAANFVNRITSLNMLGMNLLAGISNVATGTVMMRVESMSGQFFTERDTLKADKTYASELPKHLAELGSRVKTSKIALWDELFNVMQEYEQDVREANYDRKTWFSRMFGSSALFFMNNAGEHWMQNRTSLALANAYKMKGPDGKVTNLWDAMEVVYNDPNDHSKGAKLQLKEGYTKEDGSAFTHDDIIAFSRKSAAINQRMHGIYNKADRSAIQRLSIGRMAIMFRKWIKPSINRRFDAVAYNYDIQDWTEGYYRTAIRFCGQLIKELREGQLALASSWSQLTDTEKANIRRATTEVAHFGILALFLGLMDGLDKWGDKDRPWAVAMAEYQARRLYTELGSLVPGPQMSKEAFTILKSPAAGIKTMEGVLDLVGLLNPLNYEVFGGEDALLKSGRYKGHSRAYRLFFESPAIPMNKTIYRGLHPEESVPFFKQ